MCVYSVFHGPATLFQYMLIIFPLPQVLAISLRSQIPYYIYYQRIETKYQHLMILSSLFLHSTLIALLKEG